MDILRHICFGLIILVLSTNVWGLIYFLLRHVMADGITPDNYKGVRKEFRKNVMRTILSSGVLLGWMFYF